MTTRAHPAGRGLASVEPARIGLGDVRDEVGLVASRLAQDVGEAEEDLAVGELLEGARGFHAHNIGGDFSRAGDRACGAPRPGMRFEASEANARLLARRRTRGARSAGRLLSRANPLPKVVKGKMQPVLNSRAGSPSAAHRHAGCRERKRLGRAPPAATVTSMSHTPDAADAGVGTEWRG